MMPGTICIKDIAVNCVLGVPEKERLKKQTILITLSLVINSGKAVSSDKVEDTVDYQVLTKKVISFVSNSKFHLLESLAGAVLNFCLEDKKVLSATVRIEKPKILSYCKGVFFEITKSNEYK